MGKKISLWSLAVCLLTLAAILLTAAPVEETAGLPAEAQTGIHGLLQQLQDAEAGQGPGAEQALAELAERDDAIGHAAILALAEKRRGLDDVEPLLRRALELYEQKEVRYQLAAWLADRGERDAAVNEYLLLLPDGEALAALLRLDAHTLPVFTALASASHWQAVLEFYETLAGREGGNALPPTAIDYYIRALVALGRYSEALPLLQEQTATFPAGTNLIWQHARVLEAAGQVEAAIRLYAEAGTEGAYRRGLLLEKAGKNQQAAAAYAQSLEPAALWRGAVLWDEMGNRQKALELYNRLRAEAGPYQDDAAYRAYLLLRETDVAEAELLLAELSSQAAWAHRLGKEPLWPDLLVEPAADSELMQKLDAYRSAARDDLVAAELAIAWSLGSAQDKISLGQWYLDDSNYPQAVRWGSRVLREFPYRRAYELAYPRPYADEVARAAEEFALEPALLWAVMREESRYRADAVSRVGALGLMQVMPATGQEIAASLRVTVTEQDLLRPEVNIRFGAYYLRAMLNRYDGDVDKALAAYNGGPGNVRRWSNSALGQTAGGFPTAVTFLETREYITKVTNGYLTYRWLYDHEGGL